MKKKKRLKSRRKSIYFVLWTAFTAFSFVIVVIFGISQGVSVRETYESAAAESTVSSGNGVRTKLEERVRSGGVVNREFLFELSMEYNVRAYIYDSNGNQILPEETFSYSDGLSETVVQLIEKLQKTDGYRAPMALKKTENSCVYVSDTEIDGEKCYVVVQHALELNRALLREVNGRTVMLGIFVVVLSFVISASISGFFVRPLGEMTEKAKRLAAGDFSVDFKGASYGTETDELAQTLNFARDELSKADSMQKELIANVSHDFKTPLTMIKAYASMIQEISGNDPVKREKHAQVIIDEADRLTALVSDVLDLSKITSGLNEVAAERFDLSVLTSEILSKFGYLAETQGYVFKKEIDGDLYTKADRMKIGQVIYNLIGNAVNYTGEDKSVTVRLRVEGDAIRFSVTDTGAGVPEDELPHIWDRYYRSAETHKRPVKGSGLGLSIVKAALERHGFRYGANSSVGKGSEFYVWFPLA